MQKIVTVDPLTELVVVLPAEHSESAPFLLWIRGFHTRGATRLSIWDGEIERVLYVASNGPTEVGLETY